MTDPKPPPMHPESPPGDPESPSADRNDQNETLVPDRGGKLTVRQPDRADPFETIGGDNQRRASKRKIRYDALVRGDQIGDFLIQRLLGRGGFGAVYLARELSLDRLVAIKVVLAGGQTESDGEGRSLARLKHPNIVGVYGEAYDERSGCKLLWMQYVDGRNLATVIEQLHQQAGPDWNEADLLRMIATDCDAAVVLPDRGPIRGPIETVCRIGGLLADAVGHAHRSGVAHRDIKPANVLMQRDGTPMLADFNLATNESDRDRKEVSGGTIAYMPPEQFAHLLGECDAFDGARADIYSLGVLLWELACGSRPHADGESKLQSAGRQRLLDTLRLRQQPLDGCGGNVHVSLAATLCRAMSVDPQRRYPSARAMAKSLHGLAQLQRARDHVEPLVTLDSWVRRHLFWVILVGGVAPHLAASALQSQYNQVWIDPSVEVFNRAFLAYNIVVYPACVGWLAWHLHKFAQGYRKVISHQPVPKGELRGLRDRLLRLPRQFMIVSALGWFPGIVLFPMLLALFGETPSSREWFHYAITFSIAGLIATTYSYAIVLYTTVCYGYSACWQMAAHYRERARYELSGMQSRVRRVAMLAGVLPLAAAVLLLAIGVPAIDQSGPADPASLTQYVDQLQQQVSNMKDLHTLVIALVVFGAIGLYVVETASGKLIRVVRALSLSDE